MSLLLKRSMACSFGVTMRLRYSRRLKRSRCLLAKPALCQTAWSAPIWCAKHSTRRMGGWAPQFGCLLGRISMNSLAFVVPLRRVLRLVKVGSRTLTKPSYLRSRITHQSTSCARVRLIPRRACPDRGPQVRRIGARRRVVHRTRAGPRRRCAVHMVLRPRSGEGT